MIKKVEIAKKDEASVVEDYSAVFDSCYVDLDKPIKHPETLISIGTDSKNWPIPVCTAGEFSCTVAPSKTKKSFLKSLISAAYIGGNTNHYTGHITGHRKGEQYILDIDTEQGEYYAQRTFQRTMKLTGAKYDYYIPTYTRKLSPIERVKMTDWVLYKSKYAGKIKLVLIDGIADYVEDANNLVMSNEIAHYLLKWTDELKIHVHTIIHKTWGADKATGHLGSAVTKKAETLIFIDPLTDSAGKIYNYNTVKVRCGVSRGKMFDDFYLSINSDGLPFTHTLEHDNQFSLNMDNENTILEYVAPPPPNGSISEAFGPPPEEKKEDVGF